MALTTRPLRPEERKFIGFCILASLMLALPVSLWLLPPRPPLMSLTGFLAHAGVWLLFGAYVALAAIVLPWAEPRTALRLPLRDRMIGFVGIGLYVILGVEGIGPPGSRVLSILAFGVLILTLVHGRFVRRRVTGSGDAPRDGV